jgi:hypothetical protein
MRKLIYCLFSLGALVLIAAHGAAQPDRDMQPINQNNSEDEKPLKETEPGV